MMIDTRYALWDSDGGQGRLSVEGTNANACHRAWNNGVLTTISQRICLCFNDSITIVAGVKFRIAAFHLHGCHATAIFESINADAGHTLGNCHRSKAAASIESIISNAGYVTGNGN